MDLSRNCKLIEATAYTRDMIPISYAISRNAMIRVNARRFAVINGEVSPCPHTWIIKSPLVSYCPVFDLEGRVKMRDFARVEPHPDLIHPWYKQDKDKLIRVRSGCDIHHADWKELELFCDRLMLQIKKPFTVHRQGVKTSSGWWANAYTLKAPTYPNPFNLEPVDWRE